MDLDEMLVDWFRPGAVYAVAGAGGKSTLLARAALALARTGVRVIMSTTTRVAGDEFPLFPVTTEPRAALGSPGPVLLVAGSDGQGKLTGVAASLIDDLPSRCDTVVLVEADGSRRLPAKAPTWREPVIPASSRLVLNVMGASALGAPIDEAHVYNHEAVLRLLGRCEAVLGPAEAAGLARSPDAGRRGVPCGAAYRLLFNQADLAGRLEPARQALRLSGEPGAVVSLQQGVVYDVS